MQLLSTTAFATGNPLDAAQLAKAIATVASLTAISHALREEIAGIFKSCRVF